MNITKIREMLNEIRETSFIAEYRNKATEEELMGLLVSKYFGWDGLAILKATYSALEDANFHGENKEIRKMIERIEGIK